MYGIDKDVPMKYTARMNKNKVPTTMRLSPDVLALLVVLKEQFGVSRSAFVELAVREWAERKGVVVGGHATQPREGTA